MKLKLAYGVHGLWLELPDRNVTVLNPKEILGLQHERQFIRTALRAPVGSPPLRELVKANDTVAIVFSDITRPQPRRQMLSVLLDEIAHVPMGRIVLINALGTHRANTRAELADMLGPQIAHSYRILQHNAWDQGCVLNVGRTSLGHQAYVNRDYMKATVKILTGFIEPHHFAGFSGGPKAVLPGVAGQSTILANHSSRMIASPRAVWGVTEGNPIWEEMCEVALMTSPAFLLNVALNSRKEIVGVFAGDLIQAHTAGAEFVRAMSILQVREPADIVITTNAGYPLDLNLYQSVKGISAAAQVVKPGGAIIIATECRDGLPDHGEYADLLRMVSSPEEALAVIGTSRFSRVDQWAVQAQAKIQMKANVYVKSTYLSPREVRRALFSPCMSIENTLSNLLDRYGSEASILVLPEGFLTVPYVDENPAEQAS